MKLHVYLNIILIKVKSPTSHNHNLAHSSTEKSFSTCDSIYTMKNAIQQYLNWIPLGSEDLYSKIQSYKMNYEEMQANGYPLPDREDPSKISIMFHNVFDARDDPSVQKCRCGKFLSILKNNWYLDKAGCTYHPGKRIFSDGKKKAKFNCCGQTDESLGCAFGEHHVSFHRPHLDISFLQTVEKDVANRKKPSNIFALDCEMVFTTSGLELAKVSLLDISGHIVYDSYVLPEHQILDYNFEFSGVDESMLRGVTTTLSDVQNRLSNLLNKDSILIGHCLANDLLALNMAHECVVDTAWLFPHELGHPYRNSLKHLSLTYLQKNIQGGKSGHNSVEDARSCMELVLWKVFTETRRSRMTFSRITSCNANLKVCFPSSNFTPISQPPLNDFTQTSLPNTFTSAPPSTFNSVSPLNIFPPTSVPNTFSSASPPGPFTSAQLPSTFPSLHVGVPANVLYFPFRPAPPGINFFCSPHWMMTGALHWWPFWRRPV